MREGLHRDLARLDGEVVAAGRNALRAVQIAATLLEAFEVEDVETVTALDGVVRAQFHSLEHDIEVLLARQAPVAGDLRHVLTLLAIMRHVERIGRNADRVAGLSLPRRGLDGEDEIAEPLLAMAGRAVTLVEASLDAFRDRDVAKAEGLRELASMFDGGSDRLLECVFANAQREALRPWALRMLIAARWLHRIGDHAVAIGERTLYLATGERRELGPL